MMANDSFLRPPEGVTVERRDSELSIAIDATLGPELSSWLFQQAKTIREPVVRLWVRRLRGISSAFVGLLMAVQRELAGRRKRLVLLNPAARLRDLIHLMELKGQLEIETTPSIEVCALTPVASPEQGVTLYRCNGARILVLEGENGPAYQEAIRWAVADLAEPLAIHVGRIQGVDGELASLLLGLAGERRGRGRVTVLLNPTVDFERILREMEAFDRMPCVTDLSRELAEIVKPGPF